MDAAWRAGIADHLRLAARLEERIDLLERFAAAIVQALESGRRVYLAGNGGSAADAQHIAAELVGRFMRERRALPATALTTDTSALTAIGNDYGFDAVFRRQVEALVEPGDVLWVLSTSGNSVNVLEAAAEAKRRGAVVLGFTGSTGGRLRPLCDLCLCVEHDASDRVQEIHQLAYHLICQRVEARFTGPA